MLVRSIIIMGCSLVVMTLTTWLVVSGFYNRLLQLVTHNIKALRLGQVDRLQLTDRPLEIAEINNEFIQLYDALVRARSDLNVVNHNIKGMISFHTEKFRRDIRFLKQKINTDSMTGLSNRGHLDAQLPVFYEHACKNNLDLACLMVDIDNFKIVNDTLGHAVGDQVVYFVSELLQGCVRDCDFVARYGGDEFAILLLDCSSSEAAIIAERICRMFAGESLRFAPQIGPGMKLPNRSEPKTSLTKPPSLSIGLATINAHHPVNAGHLLKLADASLYEAKHAGRNCVKVG